jgi:uncharacterized membrane protein YsdA (DUF1294 family)
MLPSAEFMLFSPTVLLLGLTALIPPLRSGFYILHLMLVSIGLYLAHRLDPAPLPPHTLISMGVILHLTCINIVTFLMYWMDKNAAKNGAWRVPEKRLKAFAFIGGTPAAYAAMKLFRHKVKKKPFQFHFWLMVALQVIVVIITLLRT